LLPSAFSARWSGSLTNQASGQVTFFATIASGLQERIRLTVDGQQVIESSALATSFSGQLNFKGLDMLHEIMVEYSAQTADSSAAARFSLDWKMAGFERQVIPSSRLLPLAGRYEVKYNATVKNITMMNGQQIQRDLSFNHRLISAVQYPQPMILLKSEQQIVLDSGT
jgi:hypothetical protein